MKDPSCEVAGDYSENDCFEKCSLLCGGNRDMGKLEKSEIMKVFPLSCW